MATPKIVKSISDLLKNLKNDIAPKRGPAWFRGHSDISWTLEPTFNRLKKPPLETELLNSFRQNAHILLRQDKPFSDFDWMFLMQHYGVPTRLLDWSESPLTALYFALTSEKPAQKKKDAALWILYPHELNNYSHKKASNYIPAFEEKDFLDSYSVEQYAKGTNSGILPLAAIATRNSPRIQAQTGVFTISHQDKTPIDQIGDKKHTTHYKIPASNKGDLLHELELLQINKFQLFPELPTIGESITKNLK